MSEERCETCRFWHDELGGYFAGREEDGLYAHCRRYPPVIQADWGFDQPLTANFDWCGEHRPIGEKSDVEAQ